MRFPVCVAATIPAGVTGAEAIVIRGTAYTQHAVQSLSIRSGTLTVRLPAGEVVVQAVDPGGAMHERRVQVPPGGEAIARFGD